MHVSQNYRMAEGGRGLWRLWCSLLAQSRVTQSRPRDTSSQLLRTAEDGASTTPLGNLCQRLVFATVKEVVGVLWLFLLTRAGKSYC